MTLAAGLDYIDLNFLGRPGIIATGVLHGSDGLALVDPGPTTTLPGLKETLQTKGFALADVRAILLTHIHLDHAASTGSILAECPRARVFVHERGAPHLVDPSKLMASATRLYGADMERLWGEMRPVPAANIETIGERGRFDIVGHDIDVAWTPGHAWHHVSYFARGPRVAFVGDVAGICRTSGRVVLPPTPPPDIDLEAWQMSTDTILAWNPDVLFLTHFGPQRAPRVHFQDLWIRLDDWRRRVAASLAMPGTDEERSARFVRDVTAELERSTSPEEAEAYARAGRFDFSWSGLARYLRGTGLFSTDFTR